MHPATHHHIAQRASAILLVFLGLWFVWSLKTLTVSDPIIMTAWIQKPRSVVLMTLLILTVFYHAFLGLQMVLEDYVSNLELRRQAIHITQWICVALTVFCVLFVLTLAFFGVAA